MTSTPWQLNLATWIPVTTAEGPGKRFALWVQGCTLRCPGCCNPEMFGSQPKHLKSTTEVLAMIREAQEEHGIEGITCLGGEPFEQSAALAELARLVQAEGLSVMVFSGNTIEEIKAVSNDDHDALLAHIDILVDGRYQKENHTEERRWIGSTNQRVHFLSERYEDDPSWKKPNSIEITFDGKEILIAGFPKERWTEAITEWRRSLRQQRKQRTNKEMEKAVK